MQLQKPSSIMMKLSLMRTAKGKEDPELPLLQRISSLELTAPQIAAQINASKSNRHVSTSTVQRRLRESGLHGPIAAKKPLLKDTNKNKRLVWDFCVQTFDWYCIGTQYHSTGTVVHSILEWWWMNEDRRCWEQALPVTGGQTNWHWDKPLGQGRRGGWFRQSGHEGI